MSALKKTSSLDFSPLSMERREKYNQLYAYCNEKASDYSFINIWGWSEERKYEWAFSEDLCWLSLNYSSHPVYWAPIGNWNRLDWGEILSKNFVEGTIFERTPQALADIWGEQLEGRIEVEDQRSEWEYLYDYSKMVTLSGNKLHKKKNLLTQFTKLYEYSYAPICPARLSDIRKMQNEWCEWRGCEESPGLMAENTAITRVLSEWENLPGLMGGSLTVDGKIIAYTVAEDLGDGIVVIHFEKGLDSYKGVYQAINQIFLSHTTGFNFVNREQDMGSEGIRQAKESYSPIGYLKKYKIRWLG